MVGFTWETIGADHFCDASTFPPPGIKTNRLMTKMQYAHILCVNQIITARINLRGKIFLKTCGGGILY